MFVVNFIVKLFRAVFSKKVRDRYAISMRSVATGNLTFREMSKMAAISGAVSCGIFLFAQVRRSEERVYEL